MYEPPQSQPEPPQGPFPPQSSYPQDPNYPPQQPPFAPVPPPKKKTGKIVGIVIGVLAVLLCCCVVGVVVAFNSDFGKSFREGFTEELNSNPENAKVGDCLTKTVREDASDAKVVDCSKPEAENKIIGIIPGITEAEFDRDNQTICDEDFPDWENVLWFGRIGGTGKVLCVAPNS